MWAMVPFMLETPLASTHFYRVTEKGRTWPDVLSGAGAYFSFGGRYNRVQQKTVYAAEDPLVSISEFAFHQAVYLQKLVGGGPLSSQPPLPRPLLPLVSEHFLWCFTLRSAPRVVNVEDPVALHTFRHYSHELLNPSAENYHRTAMLADQIRSYPAPNDAVAQGILAPSVRTPTLGAYVPRQYVFFVPPGVISIPGTQVRRWNVTLEFRDLHSQTVTAKTREIDWPRPWFRLGGSRRPVPAFGQRPHSHPFDPGTWYQIEVRFA
jgi:RES domain